MSENRNNDGGPAFPHDVIEVFYDTSKIHNPETGMSLRDYFAAKAMQTILAEKLDRGAYGWDSDDNGTVQKVSAGMAYIMADAMLKARESK